MKKLISIFAFFFAFACADAQLYSITDSCSVLVIKNQTAGRSLTYPKNQLYADTTPGVLNLRTLGGTIVASWSSSQVSSLPASSIHNGYATVNYFLSYTCVHSTGQTNPSATSPDTLYITDGRYLPDTSNTSNVSGANFFFAYWSQIDSIVYVDGEVNVKAKNTGVTTFNLSLPIPVSTYPFLSLSGLFNLYNSTNGGAIIEGVGNTAQFTYTATDTALDVISFHFRYVNQNPLPGKIVSNASTNIYNSDGFVNASQRRVNFDMSNNVIAIIDTSTAFNPFGLPHGLAMGYLQGPFDYFSYGSTMYIASDSNEINITNGIFQKQSPSYMYTEPVDPIIDSSVMVVVGNSIGSWYTLNDIRGWSLNGNAGTGGSGLSGTTDSSTYTAGAVTGRFLCSKFIAKNSTYAGQVGMVGIAMLDPINNYQSNISCDPLNHTVIDDINYLGDSSISINLNNSTQILSFGFYNGYYNLPNTSPAMGQTMVSDGSNNLSWQNATISGATGSEPSTPYLGQFYFDTTITKMKFWNGTVWAVITSTP